MMMMMMTGLHISGNSCCINSLGFIVVDKRGSTSLGTTTTTTTTTSNHSTPKARAMIGSTTTISGSMTTSPKANGRSGSTSTGTPHRHSSSSESASPTTTATTATNTTTTTRRASSLPPPSQHACILDYPDNEVIPGEGSKCWMCGRWTETDFVWTTGEEGRRGGI